MDLVGNDVDTLHEERIHLVGFISFIRVIDSKTLPGACVLILFGVSQDMLS